MIFVTVGTTDFDDLICMIDQISGELNEKVIAQIGRGNYIPDHMEYFRFASSLDCYIHQARIVICHGGLGTVIEALEKGAKVIGVSNPDRYDLHQEEILRVFAERGHLTWCSQLSTLPNILQEIENRTFVPYEKPRCSIAKKIKEFLDS